MHEFAKCLKNYLDRNGISCRSAAAMCQIERTSLSKYIKGTRKPRSKDVVIEIGKGLDMSAEDMELLCEAYENDKKGQNEDIGYNIIENIYNGKVQEHHDFPYEKLNKELLECIDEPIANLKSKEEIMLCIDNLLSTASSLKIRVNMDCTDVIELIRKNCAIKNNCKIEQIIDTNNSGKENEMIFRCFEKLTPLLLLKPDYTVFYHFCWKKTSDKLDLKTNYIIADTGVLMFNSEFSYGLRLCENKCYGYFEKKFNALRSGSRMFAESRTYNFEEDNNKVKYQIVCNQNSGMEFIFCDTTGEVFIGKIHEKQRICVKEENIISKVKQLIECKLLEKEAD